MEKQSTKGGKRNKRNSISGLKIESIKIRNLQYLGIESELTKSTWRSVEICYVRYTL